LLSELNDKFLIAAGGLSLARLTCQLIYDHFSSLNDIIAARPLKTPECDYEKDVIEKLIVKIKAVLNDEAKKKLIERSLNNYCNYKKRVEDESNGAIKVECVSIFDDNYPENLKHIPAPPLVLFIAGTRYLKNSKNFSVVGTRNPSKYALDLCEKFTAGLSSHGYTIISGMALGIDACAHQSALDNKAATYAVLGTGFDRIYPAANRELYKNIMLNGAVISEYLPSSGAEKFTFVSRSRIISGLSNATLVVAAGETSGALKTADFAFEQSRDVYTVCGDIGRSDMPGCHLLLKRNQAKLVTNIADILNETNEKLELKNKTSKAESGLRRQDRANRIDNVLKSLGDREQKIYKTIEELSIKTELPPSIDEITEAAASFFTIEQTLSVLTELELKGIINSLLGKRYEINR